METKNGDVKSGEVDGTTIVKETILELLSLLYDELDQARPRKLAMVISSPTVSQPASIGPSSNPSLSQTHAVIEAERQGCTAHNVKSTTKGGVSQKPHTR